MMEKLTQVLLLLAIAFVVVMVFHRLRAPTTLGYLLVGVILGPFTFGPSVYVPEFQTLAEFGVVFLLFTIGLNFSLPQLHALRHRVLGLGTGQVVLTTLVVGGVAWLAGLPMASAFVIGAVFAQSSTTILSSQLSEQGEENSHHGRYGLAMSVFQDVTAVPFLIIIPVLGMSVGADVLGGMLGWAFAKAIIAFLLLFFIGRWSLRPLFYMASERQSAEIFTLAVLLVALLAAWTTNMFGLSLAFGGFVAGMMLGETEFRHQVESTIRPFRDVLLGLFFIGIGMRFDPFAIVPIWHWAVLGALLIIVSKTLIVTGLLRVMRVDAHVSWRTGLLLAVGGEFGLALVAIALDSEVIGMELGQVAMSSVLLSMVVGAFLIRYNGLVSKWFARSSSVGGGEEVELDDERERQVVIGGYGRVGKTVAVLLQSCGLRYVAFDTDAGRVAEGRAQGRPVYLGDIADPELLTAIHIERASLVVITVNWSTSAYMAISYLRKMCPQVPIIARARDMEASLKFLEAGATHAQPEAIEASLQLGETALRMLRVSDDEISAVVQDVRDVGYTPVIKKRGE